MVEQMTIQMTDQANQIHQQTDQINEIDQNADQIIDQIKFNSHGLVPIVTQDAETKEVLMLAYANREALVATLETKQAHYYSRSRNELWHKGATSGHIQHIHDVRYDCDNDAVLYMVKQDGVACHTGNYSCFYRSVCNVQNECSHYSTEKSTLSQLQNLISDRRANPKEGSYTNYLFEKGIDKILKKVGEESSETIIAAKNANKEEITCETADLLYHLTVMLTDLNINWSEIMTELKKREK